MLISGQTQKYVALLSPRSIFLLFWDGLIIKIALILIYNVFVIKVCVFFFVFVFVFFFRNKHQKDSLTCTFLVHPVRWQQTNIFLSLASSKKLFLFLRYLNFCISIFSSFSPCWPLLWTMVKDKFWSLSPSIV